MTKQSISPMIGIILLVAVSTILAMSIFFFVDSVTRQEYERIDTPELIFESQFNSIIEMNDIVRMRTPFNRTEIEFVLIDGIDCGFDRTNVSRGTFNVNISTCRQGLENDEIEMLFQTDRGVFRIGVPR